MGAKRGARSRSSSRTSRTSSGSTGDRRLSSTGTGEYPRGLSPRPGPRSAASSTARRTPLDHRRADLGASAAARAPRACAGVVAGDRLAHDRGHARLAQDCVGAARTARCRCRRRRSVELLGDRVGAAWQPRSERNVPVVERRRPPTRSRRRRGPRGTRSAPQRLASAGEVVVVGAGDVDASPAAPSSLEAPTRAGSPIWSKPGATAT